MSCCPCSRRTKVILIAVSDLIVGTIGLALFGSAFILSSIDNNKDPEGWIAAWHNKGLGFEHPLLCSASITLMGISTVSAAAVKCNCCAIFSSVLRVVWVLFWVWMTGIMIFAVLFYNGLRNAFWPALLCIFIPGVYASAQIYFTHVVLNYREKELGREREDEPEAEPEPEPSVEFSPFPANGTDVLITYH